MKHLGLLLFLISVLSCSRNNIDVSDDNEGITTVQLTVVPVSESFSDNELETKSGTNYFWREGKGDLVQLDKNQNYYLQISYLNESGLNVSDETEEIEKESDAHLVLIKSTPEDFINVKFLDKDSKGRKLGLKNKIKGSNKGGGNLRVILLHQPPVHGKDVKDGINENIGSTDSDVSFPIIIK